MMNPSQSVDTHLHFLTPGCLESYLDQFAAELTSTGYKTLTISNYLQSVAHFGTWMQYQRLALATSLLAVLLTGCDSSGDSIAEVNGKPVTQERFDAYLKFKRVPTQNNLRIQRLEVRILPGVFFLRKSEVLHFNEINSFHYLNMPARASRQACL